MAQGGTDRPLDFENLAAWIFDQAQASAIGGGVKAYNFGSDALHPGRVKTMNVIFRGGVNPASGSYTAGMHVRIKHSPSRGLRRVNL